MNRELARNLQAFQEADELKVLGVKFNSVLNEPKLNEIQRNDVEINDIDKSFRDLPEASDDSETDSQLAFESDGYKDTDLEENEFEIDSVEEVSNGIRNIQVDEEDNKTETKLDVMSSLPNEIFGYIMIYIGENWFDRCKTVHFLWNKRISEECSELIWRQICISTYVQPAFSSLRTINGQIVLRKYRRFKDVAFKRPRIKFSGVYIHKYTYIRDRGPPNMWNKDFDERFLEVSHYRYVLFMSNGTVLYSSTPVSPDKMIPLLYNLLLNKERNFSETMHIEAKKRIFKGNFVVKGNVVTFVVNLGDYSVRFSLEIDNVDTITTISHESLTHFKSKNRCQNSNHGYVGKNNEIDNKFTFNSLETEADPPLKHSLSGLYRFERQWRFHVLY